MTEMMPGFMDVRTDYFRDSLDGLRPIMPGVSVTIGEVAATSAGRSSMLVDDVVLNFRAALVSLVPLAERVGIPWRQGDAHDEWDELATSLYKALVVEPLRWTLPEPERDRFSGELLHLLGRTRAGGRQRSPGD